MKSDLIKILDVLLDSPAEEPDMAAIKNIAATTPLPVTLLAEVVRLLWMSAEKPQEFDNAIMELLE